MSGIGKKVKEARKDLGLSQAELAKRVGLTQQAIAEIESGRSKNSLKLIDLANALGKAPEWLASIGEQTPTTLTVISPAVSRAEVIDRNGVEFARIPVYDVRFSAGFGARNDNERPLDYHEMGMAMLRRFTDAPVNKLTFLCVSGDSMEPLLFNHDWVLIDASRTNLVSPAIYAVVYDGEGFLKHASRNLETGAITLASQNPLYPQQTIAQPEGLRIIGRVVMSIRMH